MGTELKAGDAAPDFEGQTYDGAQISLKSFHGKKNVVLYFYPKDDTKGCTIEACSFRDKLQPIRALWTEVVGVSVDTLESHKRFAEKHDLDFPLISDHDKRISTAYGVLDKDGMHAERTTFIIDKQGKIIKVFPNVDVTKHVHEVVYALKHISLGNPN